MDYLIFLHSIDLIEAIQINDLEKTQEEVAWLNNNFAKSDLIPTLDQIISLPDIVKPLPDINESYIYMVFNLKNLDTERYKFHLTMINLSKERNIEKIEQFLSQTLSQEDMEDYKFADLIQMCVTIDRYDLLQQVREKLNNKITKEE